ncbi:hypothetical protein LCGC14_2393450 [marine sediment metagenome]|uniref:Uncharacterized protein n=1 Tax=marine sediment metagenome TaxID=412755 RepID=A0A0F9BXH3_9ZZZZ
MKKIKVFINEGNERKLVDVELLESRKYTVRVRLPDGNIITRKKKRDLE